MNDSLLSRFEATEAKVSKKRYLVELSEDERKRLEELIARKWTLRLLENKVVELNVVDRASDSTIGRTLKKTFSSHI